MPGKTTRLRIIVRPEYFYLEALDEDYRKSGWSSTTVPKPRLGGKIKNEIYGTSGDRLSGL